MAMTKLYDLAVKTGEYTDRQGNTKGRWKNVGSVMRGDDGGQFIMLDKTFNPAGVNGKPGSDSILVSCFTPGDRQNSKSDELRDHSSEVRRMERAVMDDEIPF